MKTPGMKAQLSSATTLNMYASKRSQRHYQNVGNVINFGQASLQPVMDIDDDFEITKVGKKYQRAYVTWNTQGSPSSKTGIKRGKFSGLERLLNSIEEHGPNISPVMFIQEGGKMEKVPTDINDDEYTVIEDENNDSRVNSKVLCHPNLKCENWTGYLDMVESGTANQAYNRRPATAFSPVSGELFISFHSTANQYANSDSEELLQRICDIDDKEVNDVIVGGDFNASPRYLKRVLYNGEVDISSDFHGCDFYVHNSNEKTHPGTNAELDYFVTMNKDGEKPKYSNPIMLDVEPSDHNPVFMFEQY